MVMDRQTTTKISGGLFRGVNSYFGGTAPQYFWVDILGGLHHNIFGWIVLDGDGQTTTKFSGGVFRGVNSYFGGAAQQSYLWVDCFGW